MSETFFFNYEHTFQNNVKIFSDKDDGDDLHMLKEKCKMIFFRIKRYKER